MRKCKLDTSSFRSKEVNHLSNNQNSCDFVSYSGISVFVVGKDNPTLLIFFLTSLVIWRLGKSENFSPIFRPSFKMYPSRSLVVFVLIICLDISLAIRCFVCNQTPGEYPVPCPGNKTVDFGKQYKVTTIRIMQ